MRRRAAPRTILSRGCAQAANSERNFPANAAILAAMSADGFTDGPPPGARDDWTIDQGWADYTAAEHQVWITLYERQAALLDGRACAPFLKGLEALDLHRSGIPDFARINVELNRLTGWSVVAVPGLVPDAVFFDHLANRRFPAGSFIRRPDQLDYLQEPVAKGKDQRFYLPTVRGIHPGQFLNLHGGPGYGGGVTRGVVKSLGYDSEKKLHYLVADTDLDHVPGAILHNKSNTGLLHMLQTSNNDNQTYDVKVIRNQYAHGDTYIYYCDFNYMSNIHSAAGDENGNCYAAFIRSKEDNFKGTVESVEWENVTAFGKLAEICQKYLVKGSQVYISGRMKTDKYQAKDGTDRYSTKIIADRMQMLGGKKDGNGEQGRDQEQAAPAPKQQPQQAKGSFDDFD